MVSTGAGIAFALWAIPFELVFFICFGIDIYDPKLLDLNAEIYQ